MRVSRWGRAPLAAMGILAIVGLNACGELSGSASTQTHLILYSGQHPQTTDLLVSAFEKKAGITVSVRSDDEDVLADQIVTEGTHSPADLFYTENSPPLEFLQGKGLLSAVPHSTLAAVPARYSSPQGDWVGVSARVSVLVYNPKLIGASQLPTSVMQLANPKYRGKLALAPGETNFQPIVTSVLRARGQAATVPCAAAGPDRPVRGSREAVPALGGRGHGPVYRGRQPDPRHT